MENTTEDFAQDANFTNDDALNASHDKIANDLLAGVKKAAKKTTTTAKTKKTDEVAEPKAKKTTKKATEEAEEKPKKVSKKKAEEVLEEKPVKAATKKISTKKVVEEEDDNEEDIIAALEAKLEAAKKAKLNKKITDVVAKADSEEEEKPAKKVKKATKVASEDEQEFEEDKEELADEDKTTFAELGIDSTILDALEKKGYKFPTPIQEAVIPLLLEGGIDVIGQAQTGTGKTAAFGLPILQNVQEGRRETQALILAPTRELAIQVANEIDSFKGKKRLNIATVYGGQPIMQQIRDLEKGADIVVGTPGRVIDLMKRRKLDLSNVEYFVLDEADEMLNMGFIEDIEFIMDECNEDRQMLLFSATMPSKIKNLAKKYMGDYELIAVKNKEVTTQNTDQIYYPVFPKDRFKVLERILLMEQDFYGIIFANTKLTVDDITRKLATNGVKAEALHGDIAQNQRERILARFKDKKCTVLVATDVAARGIDVNDLTHVINYGLPQDSEAYVHRIGRTGRAGKKGVAISLISNTDMKQLMIIEGIAKTKIRKETLPNADTLITGRKNEIVAAILDNEITDKDEHFQDIADELLLVESAEEVLVKVLKEAYRSKLNISKFDDISQPKTLNSDDSDETRLFVALGKNGGYDNKRIEEYFIEKAGVEQEAFLDVYVLEDFSFITVPFKEGVLILEKFKNIRQNGREVVTKAKAKGGSGGGNRGGGRERSYSGGGDRNERFGGGDRRERSGGGERRERSGGSDRGERSGGSDRGERFGGGDRRERSGGSDRSERSGGGERRERSGGGERRERSGGGERSGGTSSGGSFSNNYGPKKTGKSFTSKRRKS